MFLISNTGGNLSKNNKILCSLHRGTTNILIEPDNTSIPSLLHSIAFKTQHNKSTQTNYDLFQKNEHDSNLQAVQRISYVPRNPYVAFTGIAKTVHAELEMAFRILGQYPDTSKIKSAANVFALKEKLSQNPFSLSGGEAIRLNYAIAALTEPPVILGDNTLLNCDAQTVQHILEGIKSVAGKHTIAILSTPRKPPWLEKIGYDRVSCRNSALVVYQTLNLPASLRDSQDEHQDGQAQVWKDELNWKKSVRVRELSLPYTVQNNAADTINLDLYDGETLGIYGKNGCGKTTFLKCLAGIKSPKSGTIELKLFDEWRSIRDRSLKPSTRARFAQYIYQFPENQFFRATIETELETAEHRNSKKISERSCEILRHFGLESKLKTSPFDLPASQQKFLSLSIGLAQDPKVLLLDEPDVGLNENQLELLVKALQKYRSNTGVTIIVSHDSKFRELTCDRQMLLTSKS